MFPLKLQTHPIELHFKETAISGASCACGGKVDWPAMHTSWKHFAPLRQLAPKVVEVDGSRLTKRAESAVLSGTRERRWWPRTTGSTKKENAEEALQNGKRNHGYGRRCVRERSCEHQPRKPSCKLKEAITHELPRDPRKTEGPRQQPA